MTMTMRSPAEDEIPGARRAARKGRKRPDPNTPIAVWLREGLLRIGKSVYRAARDMQADPGMRDLGLTEAALYKILRGEIASPKADKVIRLARWMAGHWTADEAEVQSYVDEGLVAADHAPTYLRPEPDDDETAGASPDAAPSDPDPADPRSAPPGVSIQHASPGAVILDSFIAIPSPVLEGLLRDLIDKMDRLLDRTAETEAA